MVKTLKVRPMVIKTSKKTIGNVFRLICAVIKQGPAQEQDVAWVRREFLEALGSLIPGRR